MQLGKFSVSLNVKDLAASKAFYEALGFTEIHGNSNAGWLIMNNQNNVTIGLFQGMFENNILTFNPGWDQDGKESTEYINIRVLQKQLIEKGIEPKNPVDETTTGPANIVLTDPDGNQILIDQDR